MTFPRLKNLLGGLAPLGRRELFRLTGLAALGGASAGAAPASGKGLRIGPDIYQSIGVKPLINCKGTFTIVSGSQTLPEVKEAMDAASRHYIHLDELMEAVGRRLAEITGAEYGIVTAGCAAALTHATAACVAGADPEKMQRLPDLRGMKNEVIAPRYSRNVYDHALRMVGVTFVEVDNAEQMRAAINDRTALVMVLASPEDRGPFGLDVVARVAAERKVPVLVDAAAERLTIPNVHLQRGATMVAYSGGKCLRGPQCAGLLLGPRNLLQAAWLNSAPHHAFGRSLKVGKEEIMGMLAAVEAWTKRDHDAEWKQWESWIDHIARRVAQVPSVATEVLKPDSLSNNAPRLRVSWDTRRVGIDGVTLERIAYTTDPRIVLGGATGDAKSARSTLTIMPYMMMPGDETVVAERLHSLLSKPPQATAKPEHPPAANLSGQWEVRLEFVLGAADHIVVFEQQGARLVGTHSGERIAGDLQGWISGSEVAFRSSQKVEGTRLGFEFQGILEGDTMRGTVELGEYGQARWTARRHAYHQPGGVVRPIKTV